MSMTMIGELTSFALPPGFDADELFDVYGSDAVTYDERDPEHNYWVNIDDVAVEHLSPEFLVSEEDDDARIYADESDDPARPDGKDLSAALAAKFEHPQPRPKVRKRHISYYKGALPMPAKGCVAPVRYDREHHCHVLGHQAKVTVRKHRHPAVPA